MLPATGHAKAQVRILRSEASHAIAFVGRTVVVHWQTETQARAVVDLGKLLASFAADAGAGGLGLLQVIDDRATPPDGAVRAALAEMLKANEGRIVASAVVFEGAGFRASVVRSIVIGISMLSRPKYPHTVFGSTSAGIDWLSRQLGDNRGDAAASMHLAVELLRQRHSVSS